MTERIKYSKHLAFKKNANLPEEYQTALFQEALEASQRLKTVNRKILLVGGAGYIGSIVSRRLLDSGYQIRCLDDLIYKNTTPLLSFASDSRVEFLRGNLCDAKVREQALKDITDVVLLAGLVGDPITKKYPQESQTINLEGLQSLIEDLKKHRIYKAIFISTCSNYGLVEGDQIVNEESPLHPLSLYARHKVEVEKFLMDQKGRVEYIPTVLRFATAFGLSPRMRFDLTVNEFCRELYLGKNLLVYDAHTWRPYCHVQDFASAILRVLEAPKSKVAFQIFNVGSDENNLTKQQIVDLVCNFVPKPNISYKEHGSDPRNYRVSFVKIRDSLHFQCKYTVKEGVREIVDALKVGLFDFVEENRTFYGNYEIFI